ncbi:MAG TPA: hypothetical protein PKZ36_00445 [Candidatus Paceibacterota bacterium]|nr:hypothetical protein [Candidatus Paceibacterota bacterium]HPT17868.1 hypothetical protein [Candidatus Paceibacterota bacterium]
MYKKYSNNTLKLFKTAIVIIAVLMSGNALSYDMTSSSTVVISARVEGGGTPPGGGGGSSGSIPTSINFSGIAYPFSKVYLLQDGKKITSVSTNSGSKFSLSVVNLSTNTYTFSIYADDGYNRKSSFFSFPLRIVSGSTINVSNILLSPTISIDKVKVKRGDNITISGKATPESEVKISVFGNQEYFYKTTPNIKGEYFYVLNTSSMESQKYQTQSNEVYKNQTSPYNSPLSFFVTNQNINKEEQLCLSIKADLNCDGYVNLIDFSIMAFWYERLNVPKQIDQNGDGVISLIDFSVLAFYWNG